ncbi:MULTISPECIES: NADH-quinone oxidoreductase subunit NuoK [unclassified Micromonospora]|uniref:NADH-quinone oxidoreductase subunit NuoK n=2 Tax=Micromonospora TaxID=1873 RepID=UPI00249C68D3|nr:MULTISPECIES: NADH-quinone oxidoreductase subunit NuoK [unclassified Micromonospora]WFE35158.1 NADH-quinone oxidoreductase subunit NuoK [Micromonospora sp. WMMD975]WFE39830.1 NADH-quinone oxidoreductase subunit NuoK [Micromonospora sp. WMMD998]
MTLPMFLLLASALFSVGLYGALSQQAVVMVMMGLELMINGVIVAAAALWWFLAPQQPDGQVLVLVVIAAMTVEMAMGFAVVTLLFRSSDADMTDMAGELRG